MQNKNMPFIVASIASLVIFLFLPFMSFGAFDASLWDVITEVGFDALATSGGIGDIAIIISLVGGVVAVVGGFINNKAFAKFGSAAGVIGIVVFFVALLMNDAPIEGILEIMGMGYWLGLIGFAISMGLANGIRD